MDKQLQQNVQALISRILPKSVSQVQIIESFLPYSMRILSSRISLNQLSEEHIKDKINQKLQTSIIYQQQFQNLCVQVQRQRFVKNLGPVLRMLYQISEDNQQSMQKFVDPIFNSNIKQIQNNRSMSENENQNVNQSTMMTSILKQSNISVQSQDFCKQINDKGNKQVDLSESDIIRDVLFVFQGIDTHYIQYNKKEDTFLLNNNIPLSIPVRFLINKLCEMGWLFRKINDLISEPPKGLINQSLHLAIKDEMNEYYKLMSILQQKIQGGDQQALNLRKLVLWTQEPFERLKWLNILTDNTHGQIGCKVISTVNSYSSNGSPSIYDLISRIMCKITQPLMKLINNWIFLGELNDSKGEFFVQGDEMVSSIDLWQNKYQFVQQQIPNIIDKEYAQKIFITGKSINFLKQCCGIKSWKLDLPQYDIMAQNTEQFKTWINQANQMTNIKLMDTLIEKFQLKKHMDCIKSFLLMGQGGFIQMLMDLLSSELNQIASQVHKHNLVGLLEQAIRSSNAQYYSIEFIQRLDVKLLEASTGDQGWDIFSLDYQVENPISTILTPETMRYYLKIFNFLWRIKRVEHNLTNVWKSHMKLRNFQGIKNIENDFLRCNLIRNEMNHFISNLFNYFMLEVIESSYKNFQDQMEKTSDLNDVIKIHDNFVQKILDKGLLTQKSEKIYPKLIKILDQIFKFAQSQELLMLNIHEIQDKLIQQKKIFHENEDDFEDESYLKTKTNLKNCINNIRKIQKEYRISLKGFQDILKENEKFKFLSFRLDFNEYYTNAKITSIYDKEDMKKYGIGQVKDFSSDLLKIQQKQNIQQFQQPKFQLPQFSQKPQIEENKDNFKIFGSQNDLIKLQSKQQQNFESDKNVNYSNIFKQMIEKKQENFVFQEKNNLNEEDNEDDNQYDENNQDDDNYNDDNGSDN